MLRRLLCQTSPTFKLSRAGFQSDQAVAATRKHGWANCPWKPQPPPPPTLQDDIVSFRFVSVPVISVHFVSGSYRFLAYAFRFVSGIFMYFHFRFFPIPFLFVVFRLLSFPFFPVPFLFVSVVFRFVSFRFLRFVSFPMSY